jgi:hypothetical protein
VRRIDRALRDVEKMDWRLHGLTLTPLREIGER